MKFGWSSLLLLLLAQPAMAQRKYNKTISGPLEIASVKVKGGYFDMGSDDEALDRKPAHTVQLADYRMGAYEVKQQQWEAVMDENPSYYKCDECPVTNVSWDEVQEFIKKLNSTTGKSYRLPTEAEWEYAAREGNYERLTKYSRPRTAAGEILAAENNKNLRTPEKTMLMVVYTRWVVSNLTNWVFMTCAVMQKNGLQTGMPADTAVRIRYRAQQDQ
jgi:formylglycine-generating enzyme required for sulfatase activity